ncbi:P-loop containing nucleoside triphosphate hydrolase protein, partial [Mycena floridula]
GILLYGPPGTGKTLVCRALARECGAQMLLIKPTDINHKYLGESEKAIRAIFSIAAKIAPYATVFIDEVDAIFRKRTGEEKPWTVAMLTEFMQSMDGLTSKLDNKGVVVIGATNRPYDLDDAILRRLPCRMLIDLPGELQRQNILHTFLKDETLSDDIDIKEFAQLTVNYSGSDLKSKLSNGYNTRYDA